MFHLLLCIPDEHGVHSSCCGDHQERPIAHLPEPKTWRGVGDGGGGGGGTIMSNKEPKMITQH